jgi:hypothetical protein
MGVLADTNIVITFSEAMDRVSTQAAYQSADVPAAGVTFTWNAANTVLTVNPNANLAYAEGQVPTAVTAREFAISITDTAEDAAGNALEQDYAWSFRTARRITHPMPIEGHTGRWNASYMLNGFNHCITDTANVPVGDDGDGAFHQAFIEVDLSELPTNIIAWESAVLTLRHNLTEGSPNPSLGALNVEHIRVDPIESVSPTTATRTVLDTLAVTNTPATFVAEILPALVDDYDDELTVSQLRFAYAIKDNGDAISDYLTFECMEFALESVYVFP